MAFVSLHTRLFTLMAEANFVRQVCLEHSTLMAAGNVSANVVVGLAQRFQATLANVVAPYENDTALEDYAAAQYGDDPNWVPLLTQVAGVKYLVEQVIAACKACVPVDGSNRILKDTWNADGSVSVLALAPSDTASLRAALDAVVAAIPG